MSWRKPHAVSSEGVNWAGRRRPSPICAPGPPQHSCSELSRGSQISVLWSGHVPWEALNSVVYAGSELWGQALSHPDQLLLSAS